MDELARTPGQTVGPFFGIGLPFPRDSELVCAEFPGAVELRGTVFDGAGVAVPDALVELWQPDSAGRIPRASGSLRRDGWTFTGWGRAATGSDGQYSLRTVIPGPTGAGRSPYFALTVFARGLLDRLFTRAYLPGAALDTDPVLSAVAPHRRASLLCVEEIGRGAFRFDIHLQGQDETVFLAYRDEAR
ncbi:protocatechuate 3,4-dioxygenase subunit alpha [Mycobacterium vicinigordonae]|uniref:Protocatechuate 3,4-dioxygenase subunit alpha n=1 Tax=Mycobacterium vicinigordonae TaxID=1719132 RepID=A0A7D6I0F0_9MYCO|nr:protocatechuate 3,4-dioxygenase subunit alpha [Mycobacterium vicinigordonae]QLL09415.1 protocatechuate 3,4-dioxygenase subunit alpha [Mycobacterium vicinigordonae]